jgi:hypothetical protein
MTDGTKLNLKLGFHYMRRAVDTIEVVLIFHQNLVHGAAYEPIQDYIATFPIRQNSFLTI